MFPRVYFPGRYFAPVYFPQSQGDAPVADEDRPVCGTLATAPVVNGTLAVSPVVNGTLAIDTC